MVDMMDNRVCADEGCEEEITNDDLLHCAALDARFIYEILGTAQ